MNPMKRTFFILLLMAGLAQAQAPSGALLTNPETGGPLSTGWWLKVYGGVDYSMMGDLVNGTKAWQAPLQSGGYNPVFSTSNLGLMDGTEVGFSLDRIHALSIEAQNISTQTESYTYTNGGTVYLQSVTPNLLDFSLNYYRTLFMGQGNKTYVMVGGGYYHAAVSYYDVVGPGVNQSANFTGDIIGGTLGAGELVALGNNIILGFSVKGRLATFSQVNSPSVVENGRTVTVNAPYSLLISTSGYPGLLTAGPAGNGYRYAVVDYSGVSGQLSIAYHF
jgi:hypothetical protein